MQYNNVIYNAGTVSQRAEFELLAWDERTEKDYTGFVDSIENKWVGS